MSVPEILSNVDAWLGVIACVLFVVGLKLMSKPGTARLGNTLSAVGMGAAVVGAMLHVELNFVVVVACVGVGAAVGALLAARVKMTGMPELVAMFNGLGGLASLAVGLVELLEQNELTHTLGGASSASAAVVVGGVAFSGSLVAYAKLAEKISGKPTTFPGQLAVTAIIAALTLVAAVAAAALTTPGWVLGVLLSLLALVVGVLAVVRIGGGDMPVVVSLLNSYSGIAAALAGVALHSSVLIVAGTLVGASGIMLTRVMCKAMNRSLANVLFAGFGGAAASSGGGSAEEQGTVRPITADDAYYLLEAAREVIIVPGYGMAVARAQHDAKELAGLLQANGATVRFVIHPVAGRMPGHMNVLLAEAGVPYEQLAEPQDVNPAMGNVDVALVVGANDVVNPDAREKADSPLFGMPIVDADKARNVIVLKRSMNTGFAGVQNSLFFKPNTRMLFGDAKATLAGLVAQFKAE